MEVEAARSLAEQLLADALPQRWAHTQGVAAQARTLHERLGPDAPVVEAAAWLHDIGYSPSIPTSGFHPLDGARYLRDVVHAPGVICELVAHHSGAAVEAAERDRLAEFDQEFPLTAAAEQLLNAMTACDMTVSPAGELVDPETRVAEILSRYDSSDPVHRAVIRSAPDLICSVYRNFQAKGP